MKVSDRLVVAIVAALALVGAMWVLVVSPERGRVASLSTQIDTERVALLSAQGHLATARNAAAAYVSHVHEIDAVLRAIPPSPAEAQLITTIDKLAGTNVDFHELDVGSSGSTATGASTLGLTFTFNATYGDLEKFLNALDALTTTDGANVSANGRLFTVTGVTLAPLPPNKTKATIVAQVYLQGGAPAATIGATSPTGATGATSAPATGATR